MKYQLTTVDEIEKAFAYLQLLVEREAEVDIKRVVQSRSLNQNSYLHLLLGIFGLETGYERHEAKILYKREANPDIYVYDKNGTKFMRSSADLDTAEMARSIDKFIKYAGEQGIELPAANNDDALRYWSNEIEQRGRRL